jgi:2'-5' RNA ligase
MRCFLGCDLPATAKLALDNWCEKALRIDGQYQKVKPANYHVTTLFLGNVAHEKLDSLVGYIETNLPQQTFKTFSLTLNDILAWSKPKIVAAIPQQPPADLQQLHYFCQRASDAANIQIQGKHDTYRPHATLVRKVKQEQVAAPLYLPEISFDVTHLHLFESVSGMQGVQYYPRFSFPLPSGLSIREQLRRGI